MPEMCRKNVSDDQFDIASDIEHAIKMLEEKGKQPKYYVYLTKKRRDIWKEALKDKPLAWTEKDGKDNVFGVEVLLWEDLISERK